MSGKLWHSHYFKYIDIIIIHTIIIDRRKISVYKWMNACVYCWFLVYVNERLKRWKEEKEEGNSTT